MRENLIDSAPGHDVAAQEQPDGILSTLPLPSASGMTRAQGDCCEGGAQPAQDLQEMSASGHSASVFARVLCMHGLGLKVQLSTNSRA